MAAAAVRLADAVVARLLQAESENALSIAEAITIERSYADWDLALDASDSGLRIDVVAVSIGLEFTKTARGKHSYTIPVDIAVRRKFTADEDNPRTGRIPNSMVDPLVELVEEIYNLFDKIEHLPDYESAAPTGNISISANPFAKHLREIRQFTGVVRVAFQINESIRS